MLKYFVTASLYMQARLGRDDRGATAVEYGLMVAAIAAVIVVVVFALGLKVQAAFQTVFNAFP